jgi:hypothetical protein
MYHSSKERLNNACKRALLYEAVGYNPIKNILEKGLDIQLEEPDLFSTVTITLDNIRESEYYA